MGTVLSTKNYENVIDMIDGESPFCILFDITDIGRLYQDKRYLLYKSKTDKYIFFYGDITKISDFVSINEKLLLKKSIKFNSLLDVKIFLDNSITPKVFYDKFMEYYNSLVIETTSVS